jgi:hypothetical protein
MVPVCSFIPPAIAVLLIFICNCVTSIIEFSYSQQSPDLGSSANHLWKDCWAMRICECTETPAHKLGVRAGLGLEARIGRVTSASGSHGAE